MAAADLQADLDAALESDFERVWGEEVERLFFRRGEHTGPLGNRIFDEGRGWLVRTGAVNPGFLIQERRNSRRGARISASSLTQVRTAAGRVIWERSDAEARVAGPRADAWAQVSGRAALLGSFANRHLYRFTEVDPEDPTRWLSERVGPCPGNCGYHCGPGHQNGKCVICRGNRSSMSLFGLKEWQAGTITLLPEAEVEAKVAELAAKRIADRERDAAQRAESEARWAEVERQEAAQATARRAQLTALRESLTGESHTLADLKRRLVPGTLVETIFNSYGHVGDVRPVLENNSVEVTFPGKEPNRPSHLRWPKASELTYVGDTFLIESSAGYGLAYRIVSNADPLDSGRAPTPELALDSNAPDPLADRTDDQVASSAFDRCRKCNQPLTDPRSRSLGLGPDCRGGLA